MIRNLCFPNIPSKKQGGHQTQPQDLPTKNSKPPKKRTFGGEVCQKLIDLKSRVSWQGINYTWIFLF